MQRLPWRWGHQIRKPFYKGVTKKCVRSYIRTGDFFLQALSYGFPYVFLGVFLNDHAWFRERSPFIVHMYERTQKIVCPFITVF